MNFRRLYTSLIIIFCILASCNEKEGPKKTVPVHHPPSAPQAAAPPQSAIEGEESAMLAKAKQLLSLKDSPERTQQWRAILTQADYFTLVRMTEIPAQPKLTEDRKELRLAAIRQLGNVGKLGDLIAQRQAFDKDNLSLVQQAAWQEWAKIAPAEAMAAWQARVAALAPKPPNGWLIENVVLGLKDADTSVVLDVLVKLPREHQDLFYKQLAKATQAAEPAVSEQWAALVSPPPPPKTPAPLKPKAPKET